MINSGELYPLKAVIQKLVLLLLASASFLVPSCTHSSATPELEISQQPKTSIQALTNAELLALLEQAIAKSPEAGDILEDVRQMLVAKNHEEHENFAKATEAWYRALTMASGPFGHEAFKGWLRAYGRFMNKKADIVVLTKLVLAETKNGQVSPYLVSKGITSEIKIAEQIEEIIPEWIEKSPEKKPKDSVSLDLEEFPAPHKAVFPENDPLLISSAKQFVLRRDGSSAKLKWQEWISTLPEPVQIYWGALVLEFSGQHSKALETFEKAYDLLKVNEKLSNLVWSSAKKKWLKFSEHRQTEKAQQMLFCSWLAPGNNRVSRQKK